jgi:hypothetical protein
MNDFLLLADIVRSFDPIHVMPEIRQVTLKYQPDTAAPIMAQRMPTTAP